MQEHRERGQTQLPRRGVRDAFAGSAGDESDDYSWFFREEFPAVARTVGLILRDRQRAEDITQEAFIQLLRHWKKVSRYQMPDAWVRRVAIRLAVRASRREAARSALERRGSWTPPEGTTDPDLLRAIRALPPRQRAAVVLFYFEDRPMAQVADLLDCATNTAKVHLHRARARLRKELGEGGGEDGA